MQLLTHLSLFSGIGGLDLAAEAAGFVTVGQCEFADFPTRILQAHWPDVPRWRDIRTLTGGDFYEETGLRAVDIISGGFPCQPFSVAGKQKGKGDDRYLWPEMLRVIRELAPRWIVGENVPGILRIAAGDVVKDLEREGYDVALFDFEAAAVGAPHRRERIAFVANLHGDGGRKGRAEPDGQQRPAGVADGGNAMETKYPERTRTAQNVENAGHVGRSEPGVLSQQQRGTEPVGNGQTMAHAAGAERERAGEPAEQKGRAGFADGSYHVSDPDPVRRDLRRFDGERVQRHETRHEADSGCKDVSDTHDGSGDLRREWELQQAESAGRRRNNHAGRTEIYDYEKRRTAQSGLGMRHDGLPAWMAECMRRWTDGTWEYGIPRLAEGVPHRADKLKCLGNAVVPQWAYPIFWAIMEELNREDLQM